MKKRKLLDLSATQIIMLSFLAVILIGSLLLMLPFSHADGKAVSYADALFISTSAVCVTGIEVQSTATTWSFFGQAVILILMQIGGLGVVTILAGIMISLHQKISLKNRVILQDSFNLTSLAGLIKFTKQVLIGTVLAEGIGAALFMFVFMPRYGAKGIWYAVFHSVSSFCNAGLVIFSDSGMADYASHPFMNIVTSALVILGGLGFLVWWDILRVLKLFSRQKMKCFRLLTLHSKIVLSSTALLLVSGMVLYFIFEQGNPETLARRPFSEQLLAVFFQSANTRASGFSTLPQENFTNASSILTLILMFVGGSPVGTAGGIKTTTFIVLAATMMAAVLHQNNVVLFNRTISKGTVTKAIAVASLSLVTLFLSAISLACVSDAPLSEIILEAAGASTTVGMTNFITSDLNFAGRMILIFSMYFGRIGPISLVVALNLRKDNPNIVKHPHEEISVG